MEPQYSELCPKSGPATAHATDVFSLPINSTNPSFPSPRSLIEMTGELELNELMHNSRAALDLFSYRKNDIDSTISYFVSNKVITQAEADAAASLSRRSGDEKRFRCEAARIPGSDMIQRILAKSLSEPRNGSERRIVQAAGRSMGAGSPKVAERVLLPLPFAILSLRHSKLRVTLSESPSQDQLGQSVRGNGTDRPPFLFAPGPPLPPRSPKWTTFRPATACERFLHL